MTLASTSVSSRLNAVKKNDVKNDAKNVKPKYKATDAAIITKINPGLFFIELSSKPLFQVSSARFASAQLTYFIRKIRPQYKNAHTL